MSDTPEAPPPDIVPKQEQIERGASKIYLARGSDHGQDLADWTIAEREIDVFAKHAAKEKEAQISQAQFREERREHFEVMRARVFFPNLE